MQTGYFATAWNDIKNSPGWVGKMFLLALLNFIPIFGQIVTVGYLYGWARDAAWGIQGPMPKHIFGNEDGKLYSRGFFILVLSVVFALVLGILSLIVIFPFMGAIIAAASGGSSSVGAIGIFAILGIVLFLLFIVVCFAASFFIWVGEMRISIYGRLSAGFQLKKIGKMLRKDFIGILKIFGMVLLLGFIVGIIVETVMTIVGLIFGISGMGIYSYIYSSSSYSYGAGAAALGIVGSLVMLALSYLSAVIWMWVSAMSARALGYWTRQFDVPNWRGQDDPMPFELQQHQAAPHAQYYQQTPPPGAQGYAPPQQGVPVQPVQHYTGQPYPQPQPPVETTSPAQTPPAQEMPPVQAPVEPAAPTEAPVTPPAPAEGSDATGPAEEPKA